MQENFSVKTEHLSKLYKIYSHPWMRLFNAFIPRVKYREVYALN